MPTKKAPGAGFQPLSFKRAYMSMAVYGQQNQGSPYPKKAALQPPQPPPQQYTQQLIPEAAANPVVASNFDALRQHIEGYAQDAHQAIENMKNHVLTDLNYIVGMYEAATSQAHAEQAADIDQAQASAVHSAAQALGQHHLPQERDDQHH